MAVEMYTFKSISKNSSKYKGKNLIFKSVLTKKKLITSQETIQYLLIKHIYSNNIFNGNCYEFNI